MPKRDEPISAASLPATSSSAYPEPFASQVGGRSKAKLGDAFGLANFGVNLTRLAPGAKSALFHCHTKQDEFIYILAGHPTLYLGEREIRLSPGECVGFAAGGEGHQLVNQSDAEVSFLEIGDRTPGDAVSYPNDDLAATAIDGKWAFTHKDGSRY